MRDERGRWVQAKRSCPIGQFGNAFSRCIAPRTERSGVRAKRGRRSCGFVSESFLPLYRWELNNLVVIYLLRLGETMPSGIARRAKPQLRRYRDYPKHIDDLILIIHSKYRTGAVCIGKILHSLQVSEYAQFLTMQVVWFLP